MGRRRRSEAEVGVEFLHEAPFLSARGDELYRRWETDGRRRCFLYEKNAAKHPLLKNVYMWCMLLWKAELSDSSGWTSSGAGISSSCGQQNVKSSGFIVITYHARDITLLISAVFKHCRSSGAQTLLIFFWAAAFGQRLMNSIELIHKAQRRNFFLLAETFNLCRPPSPPPFLTTQVAENEKPSQASQA